uniref:Bromo domain-containing protein n=1 Tax=Syphacia muris TaxID=451379 RepID=A0A0N5AL33_9BILA
MFFILELLLAIQWYLSQSPCKAASEVLREEIQRLNVSFFNYCYHLLPRRYDFNGGSHLQTLDRYERSIPDGQPSLVTLIETLNYLASKAFPPVISRLPLRIFSSKKLSLCRNEEQKRKRNLLLCDIVGKRKCSDCSSARIFQSRQMGRRFLPCQMLPKATVQSLGLHCRISGHLSSIFCVAFDRTGHYIFTGADDRLVKVWSATSGLLRFTLRGHSAQITDISVSDDNVFLASGSLDKTMRVWNLRSAASLALFRHHTAAVTLITFLPYVCGQVRYLLSTGGDCVANFYKYSSDDEAFSNVEHICFNERVSPGSRLVSSCCSPGGSLVVIGDTHRFLRIYKLSEDGVSKIRDIEAHGDRVDSLAWAHSGLRFVSGSKDGIAKVWRFRYNDWESVALDTKKRFFLKFVEYVNVVCQKIAYRDEKLAVNSRRAYKVTMVCWTLEDDFVVTSGSDHILVVWDPISGNSLRQLEGHKEDTYVLIAHPLYREYIFSAGHDGLFMVHILLNLFITNLLFKIWDISEGTLVKRYQNQEEVNGSVPLFDFSISPDGTVVAAVDSLGRLSIFGMGASQKVKTTPKEQFFITDYMPVAYDQSGELIDEDTSLAPHLMPPSLLVDGDGTEYASEIQRLVPGRDVFQEDLLSEGGVLSSPWLNRDLVQRLAPSTVSLCNLRLAALRELEMKDYAREASRKRPVDAQSSRQPPVSSRRRIAARSSAQAVAAQELAEGPDDDLAFEETLSTDTSGDSTFDTSSSSEDDESDISDDISDSDYSLESSISSINRGQRVSGSDISENDLRCDSVKRRQRLRKRVKIVDVLSGINCFVLETNECGDEDGNDGSDVSEMSLAEKSRSSRRLKRSRQRRLSSSSEETASAISACTSPTDSSLPGPSGKTTVVTSNLMPSRTRQPISVVEFPSWMRLVYPCRFPYIAQIGDVVVYFRQGHELYLNAVESLGLYQTNQRMRPLGQLDAEEMCLVTEVKYIRKPYRLIAVKLARLDENETPTGLVFSVKYHDLENVPDFIILHRLYAESTSQIYEPGDRIESILDGHWWSGTIDKKEPYDEVNFPRSHWYSLTVRWDTGEDEKMSPWDVQLIGSERRTRLATDEELFEYSFMPRLEADWSCCGGADECERKLLNAIEVLLDEDDVKPFCAPVNLEEYPEYSLNVDYPVDLETIAKRAANKYYRRFSSMEQDIKYIAINASTFNEPRSPIVRNSRVLVETLIRYLKSSNGVDVLTLFNSLNTAPEHELTEYKKPCRIKVVSGNDDNLSSASFALDRHLDSAVSNFSVQEWMNDCSRIVETMSQSNFGHTLVDGGSETLVAAVADGCRSLTSILSGIGQRTYTSPQQVVDDVQKLLQSYRALVDDKRSPFYLQSLNFSSRFNNAMAPILAKWQRFQQLTEGELSGTRRSRNRLRKTSVSLTIKFREKRTEDEAGPSSLRSGRNARMPKGFYRNLNNGVHTVAESKRYSRRKVKLRKRDALNTADNNFETDRNAKEDLTNSPTVDERGNQNRLDTNETDIFCSSSPGPSSSVSFDVKNNESETKDEIRNSSTSVLKSESNDDEQLKDDEDFVLDEASADGESGESDSTYSSEDVSNPKRMKKTKKRKKAYNGENSNSSRRTRRSKRKVRTKLTSSGDSNEEEWLKKKRRKHSASNARFQNLICKTEGTPESGENSGGASPHCSRTTRVCRNHSGNQGPDEARESITTRSRLKKQRSLR